MRGKSEIEVMFDCVPEISFDLGFRYFLGNIENYSRALLSTLKSMKSKMPIMYLMLQTEEYEGLRSITQTLQRMFSNIGASGLAKASAELELSLLNASAEIMTECLTDYLEQLVHFSEHLEQLFKGHALWNTSSMEEAPSHFRYDLTKTKESIRRSSDLLERRII